MKKLVSIVIPAYNEAHGLASFAKGLLAHISTLTAYHREVIFVNDGSIDATWEIIASCAKQDDRVKGLNFSRNFGKELAMSAGLQYAKGAAVITLDADGQHPIERLGEFLEAREAGSAIVYNRRPHIAGASWLKRGSSALFYKVFNTIAEFPFEPQTTDYRLLDRQVVDIFLQFKEKNRVYRGLIDWMGFPKKVLVFDALPNPHGRKPSYSYNKLTQLAITSITSFSVWPLKLVGKLGGLITTLSFLMMIVIVVDKLTVDHFGFTNLGFMVMANTFFVGILMISLGLIAIYIAQIHEEVKGRPLYIIKDTLNCTSPHGA
jgi:glycosyltransferase involved in cell wall biosynthesis